MGPMTSEPTPRLSPPAGLVMRKMGDRIAALGRASAYLATSPAFAATPFGHMTRILIGQINRSHYGFIERDGAVVGFIGWARATEAQGDAWLESRRALSDEEARQGDCALINIWRADAPDVSRFIMARLRAALGPTRIVFARRRYADGRVRNVRLIVDQLPDEMSSNRHENFG